MIIESRLIRHISSNKLFLINRLKNVNKSSIPKKTKLDGLTIVYLLLITPKRTNSLIDQEYMNLLLLKNVKSTTPTNHFPNSQQNQRSTAVGQIQRNTAVGHKLI